MASIVPLARRVPVIRGKRITPAESESSEAARSMRVLLWTFALTAIAMCATVVVCFASNWSEVLWISSFLLVFALCKIALANALFYVMVHYDADTHAGRTRPAVATKPLRSARALRRSGRTGGALRIAAGSSKSPRPSTPR